MKTAVRRIKSNISKQVKKSNRLHSKFFPGIALLLLLLPSCSQDDAPPMTPDNTLTCKNKPGQITFGKDATDIKYNTQGQPVKLITTEHDPAAPSQAPVITVYMITYNANGKADKVTKLINDQPAQLYQMAYNSNGQLIKQSSSNAQGVLIASTTVQYDNSNMLSKITTHTEGSSTDVTSVYQYANGTLIKKSIQNLYDMDSQEFYNADYTYTYFPDKENKIKSYFEGPLGLIFISNLSHKESLQYLPGRADYQLFFARETSSEKKMLQNIEIIAHRYNARDTSHIEYSYEYDTDGFPTVQKGIYKNVTRRYVPTPFGGSVFLVTPYDNSFLRTMNFNCD